MKTLDQLDLHVPSLGVKSARKLFGGNYDGGYLDPAICYGSSSGMNWGWSLDVLNSFWDSFLNSFYNNNDGSNGQSGDSVPFQIQPFHLYHYDEVVSDAERAWIDNVLDTLPEELQAQNFKIVIAPEYLRSHLAEGMFLPKGSTITWSNGEMLTLTEDTIFLSTAQSADRALWEEALHMWQFYHNVNIPARLQLDPNMTSCMELQADVIEALVSYAREYSVYGTLSPDILPWQFMDTYNSSTGGYDLTALSSLLSSYYSDTDGFSYNWHDVLEMFFGNQGFFSGFTPGPY